MNVFGVTYQTVRQDIVPWFDDFSAVSSPTSTALARWIDEEAADLSGKLLAEAIDMAEITDSATAAYLWCRKTLTLMVGARLIPIITSQYPEVAQKLAAELKARLEDLETNGATALGDESLSTSASDPDGPTDHIQELGLDVGDLTLASSVAPVLRKDDEL